MHMYCKCVCLIKDSFVCVDVEDSMKQACYQ